MGEFIYLDHGATTPLDPAIGRGMLEREATWFGNPASLHPVGRAAGRALDEARARLAEAIGGAARELVFTAGATEALGMAVLGAAGERPGRVAISAVEHAAVRTAAQRLVDERGWALDVIPVDSEGRVQPEGLAEVVGPETRIVAVMLANNEVGAINDVAALAKQMRARAPRARLVVDAVQAVGKLPVDVRALDADCVALTGHKLHGPKGVGALWSRVALRPLLVGGGQEDGRRGGTQSAPLAWALAEAVARQRAEAGHLVAMRDRLWARVEARVAGVHLTGPAPGRWRLGNNLHVCVPGLPGEPLFNALAAAGVCVSTGSACRGGAFSRVLAAMGRAASDGAYLRLTTGRFTTEAEVDTAADRLAAAAAELRALLGVG